MLLKKTVSVEYLDMVSLHEISLIDDGREDEAHRSPVRCAH